MRIIRSLLLVPLIAALWPPGAALGQTPTRPAPDDAWREAPRLGLADAVSEALAHNPGLEAARAAALPVRSRVAQEEGLMPPRVEGQIWRWPLTTLDPGKVDMYMFMVEQDLPGRGKRAVRAALAESEARLADAEVQAKRLEIAAAVRRTYAALALARRDVSNAWAAARSLEQLVDVAHATYAAGGGSQAAVVRALLAVTRLDERVAALGGDERMAAVRLNAQLGRVVDAPIGPLDEPRPATATLSPAQRVQRAADQHPEVQAALAALSQAERAIESARQERRPDWMVRGGYMLMPGDAGAWTASVGLTWPAAPWARKRIAATIAEAEGRRGAAAAAVEAARARIRTLVQEAVARLEAAEARRVVLRTSVIPHATHLVESTRLSFEAGQGPLAEALEARQVLLEAELDEARAAYEVEEARANLEAAGGDDWLSHVSPDAALTGPPPRKEF